MDWYTSRITARAVLSIVALSYSLAPEWEPLPKIHLSQGDLDIIARREEDHINRIKRARTMANNLLVRIVQNATEQDHLVEYGKNSTALIHEQLQKKRRANTSSTRQSSSSTRQSSISVVDESGVCVFLCDIEECIEPALQSSAPCEHQHCRNYVFCDMHQLHESHSIGHTMRSKREMFQATETLNLLTSVDKANKKKKKKTCQGSTHNSIAEPIISSTVSTHHTILDPYISRTAHYSSHYC